MNKLDRENELFKRLTTEKPDWWEFLVSQKDLYIDIRKDNYIDVYYHGGNIIRELRFDGEEYSGSINSKYLLPQASEYIKYGKDIKEISLELGFSGLNKDKLKEIKCNIAKYYSAQSEKGLQSKFVTGSESCFIDTEFAYNYDDIKLRIDLVWIDTPKKKIMFVELKTMDDSRLYTDEISEQVQKYNDFATKYEKDILEYYKSLFSIKKKLGILPDKLNDLESLDGFTLEKRPLLLFGDCKKEWIDNNANCINEKIKDSACGAYYFGLPKYNCDLINTKKKNRFVF